MNYAIQGIVKEGNSYLRNTNELIADLCGNREVRDAAKRELIHIRDEDLVLLAKQSELNHKGCWSAASEVLREIGYPRIKPVTHTLWNGFTM